MDLVRATNVAGILVTSTTIDTPEPSFRISTPKRRAKLEGRHIGRIPLDFDRSAVLRDRGRGMSLTEIAEAHRISRATVSRVIKKAREAA